MNELATAIYNRMSADATLIALLSGGAAGIYLNRAPLGSKAPLLIYQMIDGTDLHVWGGLTRIREVTYSIRAVIEGFDNAAAKSILARVDTLLHDAPLSVNGHTLLYVRRAGEDADLIEDRDGGLVYQVATARYQFEVQPS